MMRRPCSSAYRRASSGIWRRAPGVPCIQMIAAPRGEPYSAKLSRRPSRTATVPSRAGRWTSVTRRVSQSAEAMCDQALRDSGRRTIAGSTTFRRVAERAEQPAVADHGRPVDQVDDDDR